MSARQFVNDPDEFIPQALEGLRLAHPHLIQVSADPALVLRTPKDGDPLKVALVSGGGSGHEPLHTGFVGLGMLDAAIPGAVFASPTAYQIRAGIKAVDRGRGVLLIVKNYTGDVLNFSIAAELAREENIEVEIVLVDDDLATDGGDEGGPGRRGTAAVVAVEKICGAAAERGASLSELAELGRRVVASSRTMALALRACTHPGQQRPSFDLADDEVEFGVGIHGERGVGQHPFGPASELVPALAQPVVEALGLQRGESVIAIVNGLGSTHALELAVVHRELSAFLEGVGVRIERALVGSYVTALDMQGCSITLVRCDSTLLELWNAPVRTPALAW
ncbi:dihydroxyacetone kinase subunit DhaK [Allokutzneria multivorans]